MSGSRRLLALYALLIICSRRPHRISSWRSLIRLAPSSRKPRIMILLTDISLSVQFVGILGPAKIQKARVLWCFGWFRLRAKIESTEDSAVDSARFIDDREL